MYVGLNLATGTSLVNVQASQFMAAKNTEEKHQQKERLLRETSTYPDAFKGTQDFRQLFTRVTVSSVFYRTYYITWFAQWL